MRRKNLWLRLSSCTMAALIATTSVVPAAAAEVDFQDEASVETEETTETPEVTEAEDGEEIQEAAGDISDDLSLATDENTAPAAEETEGQVEEAEFSAEDGFSDGIAEAVQAEIQNGFGTTNKELAAGTYEVTVALKKTDKTSASMASACINGKATLTVKEDGTASLTVPLTSITMGNVTAWAKNWKVYPGELADGNAAAATEEKNADGNVSSITFAIVNKAADGVFVNMQSGGPMANDAYISIDYANATAKTEDAVKVDTKALEETIAKADALVETSYTKASWDGNKDAIETAKTAAKEALGKKESQEAVDVANTALADAIGKLVVAGDLTELKKVLEQAKVLNETDYTAESWKTADIEKRIRVAQDVIDERARKEEVKGAVNDLETAMENLVAVSANVTVGRGSFEQKLSAGTYSIPIELLNAGKIDATKEFTSADYMKQTSMAAGCFTGNATLVIHEDGTATLTTGVGAVDSAGQSGGADQWTIYENTQDFLEGKANSSTGARYKAHIDKQAMLAGKRKPSQISFTVPDLKQNVIATRMHIEIMGVYQDACIGLDWKNIKKISDETSATSTVEKVYEVNADTLTQLKNMKDGNIVKLDEDLTLSEDLILRGGTLDLNGYSLNQGDNNLIRIKGNVKIIDSSADKSGKIVCGTYSNDYNTTTTIAVEKGSFTADGVTIYGQIGNAVFYNSSNYLKGIPHIGVTLTNSTLIYTGNNIYAINFSGLPEGIDLKVDKCTIDKKGIMLLDCANINSSVTDSSMNSYTQEAPRNTSSLIFTGNKVDSSVSINADTLTVKDDDIGNGLSLRGKGDVVLENLKVDSTSARDGALRIEGSGSVVVKSGVYTASGRRAYAIDSDGYPVSIEGGYFKGKKGSVNNMAYTTPKGKILGDITEGEYAGYQTIVDTTETEVTDPAATIYNSDGSVASKISEEKASLATSFATNGQIVKLNKDISVESETYYKDITLDLNGHTLTTMQGLIANHGTCRVIDSSADKNGKFVGSVMAFMATVDSDATAIFDNITCETAMLQYVSVGKLYIVNGARIIGTNVIEAEGGGSIYIQDSTWKFAESDGEGQAIDGLGLLENVVRTAQYSIEKEKDGFYVVKESALGKAMRAFEKLNEFDYTKSSYQAAKAIYDEIDATVDTEYTAEDIEKKTKELNDAIANLQAPATEASVNALKSAITAAKKLKSTDYTAASFKTYAAAITAAEKVLKGEDLSEKEVTEASKALAAAKTKLVKVQAQTITVAVKNSKGVVSKKYGDKAFTLGAKAKGGLTYKSSNTKIATVDSKGKVTIKAAGTVKITVTAKATTTYKAATKTLTIKIAKKAATIKTKTSTKTYKYATLKKKAQVFTLGTSVDSKATLTYKKLSGSSAITVNSKTGKLTVKKGLKKGTYKVKVQIKSAAKGNYNAGSKTVTVTVKVK